MVLAPLTEELLERAMRSPTPIYEPLVDAFSSKAKAAKRRTPARTQRVTSASDVGLPVRRLERAAGTHRPHAKPDNPPPKARLQRKGRMDEVMGAPTAASPKPRAGGTSPKPRRPLPSRKPNRQSGATNRPASIGAPAASPLLAAMWARTTHALDDPQSHIGSMGPSNGGGADGAVVARASAHAQDGGREAGARHHEPSSHDGAAASETENASLPLRASPPPLGPPPRPPPPALWELAAAVDAQSRPRVPYPLIHTSPKAPPTSGAVIPAAAIPAAAIPALAGSSEGWGSEGRGSEGWGSEGWGSLSTIAQGWSLKTQGEVLRSTPLPKACMGMLRHMRTPIVHAVP